MQKMFNPVEKVNSPCFLYEDILIAAEKFYIRRGRSRPARTGEESVPAAKIQPVRPEQKEGSEPFIFA
jgi:hypothetical protein